MNEQTQQIYHWLVYEAGIQPTQDNHFGTDPNAKPRLNLFLQQRPLEIASAINFLLEKKQSGESIKHYGEIGACSGGTTFAINNFLNFETILIVDDNGMENEDFYVKQRRNLDRAHILKSTHRAEIIGSSHDKRVLQKVKLLTEQVKLDVLFVDGDHSYEGVRQDTLDYYDCVRDGGYIIFHDTAHIPGLMAWVEHLPAVVPDLTLAEEFKFNGYPFTGAFESGIGISIFQKKPERKKKQYDFLEIGTSDFDTLIAKSDELASGLSVEPHKTYLERLPDKINVHKVNAALVTKEQYKKSETIDFYYVHEDIINSHDLGWWLKGCNSVGKPHDFHVAWYPEPWVWHQLTPRERANQRTVNLLEKNLVTVEKVPCITFEMLAEKYEIGQIIFLKVDVEGQDPPLVKSIIDYYMQNNMLHFLPKEILFESNTHSDEEECKVLCRYLSSIGYDVNVETENTRAILRPWKTI